MFLYSSLGICFWPLLTEHYDEQNTRWIFELFLPSLCMFESSMKKATHTYTHTHKSNLPNVRHLIGAIKVHMRFSDSLLTNWFMCKHKVHLIAVSKVDLPTNNQAICLGTNFLILLEDTGKLFRKTLFNFNSTKDKLRMRKKTS